MSSGSKIAPDWEPLGCCCSVTKLCLTLRPWTAAHQASLAFIISWSLLKLMSIESVMPSNYLILYYPLLLLPSIFPSIRVFSNESALYIKWPKYWNSVSASVLPVNIRDWFPLEVTGLSSLQSKGLSVKVFSSTQFRSINSSMLSLLYGLTLTSVHNYWKNHSFDYTDLCWQSDVSAFWYTV